MNIFRRPAWNYVVFGGIVGVASLEVGLHKVGGVGVVLDLLGAGTAFVAGFSARRLGGKPGWAGASVGALFGVVVGSGAFFRTATASQVEQALHKTGRTSPLGIHQVVAVANSPIVHVLSLVLTGAAGGVGGLIVGAIAGAVVGRRQAQQRGV